MFRNKVIVSERGTVTIPEAIRETAQIGPGDLIEFEPRGEEIILRRLIAKKPEEKLSLSEKEWEKLAQLVNRQLMRGEYTPYENLEKAKEHSRKLLSVGRQRRKNK